MKAILIGLAMLMAGPGIYNLPMPTDSLRPIEPWERDGMVTSEPDTATHPDSMILSVRNWGYFAWPPDSPRRVRADSICAVRGHVPSQTGVSTLLAPGSYFVDLPDRTLLITYDPNSTSYECARCGRSIIVRDAQADTTIVWRRSPPAR